VKRYSFLFIYEMLVIGDNSFRLGIHEMLVIGDNTLKSHNICLRHKIEFITYYFYKLV